MLVAQTDTPEAARMADLTAVLLVVSKGQLVVVLMVVRTAVLRAWSWAVCWVDQWAVVWALQSDWSAAKRADCWADTTALSVVVCSAETWDV